jgi:hypothetical protein
MKAAIAEKEEFLRTGNAPESAAMRAAVADYRTARELATKNLIEAYSKAVGAYAPHCRPPPRNLSRYFGDV